MKWTVLQNTQRLVVLIGLLCSVTNALPTFMLSSSANKCIKIDVTSDLVLLIDYWAPDLTENKDDGNYRPVSGKDGDEEEERKLGEDGLDSRYNQRNRRQRPRLPELVMQMNHLIEENGRRRSAGTNKNGTRKLREDISVEKGRVEFFTGDRDGFVEICIQSYLASKQEPRRVGMSVTKMSTAEFEQQKEAAKESVKGSVQVPGDVQTEMLVKVETSRITTELERFTKRLKDISNGAAASKDREADFHETSIKLNRGVRQYPIFRIGVLLIAGYMQASHVVRYMKNHHIY